MSRLRAEDTPAGLALAGLARVGPLGPRQEHCPGALVSVTRQDYLALERAGIDWETRPADVPNDGRLHPARVRCSSDCMVLETARSRTVYGTCSSCAGMEVENRRVLQERLRVVHAGPARDSRART